MLQPKHTMRGFEWHHKRGVEGTGFVRAIRSLLTAQVPVFLPQLEVIIGDALRSEVETCQQVDGESLRSITAVLYHRMLTYKFQEQVLSQFWQLFEES